jgi:signal transduction histidine kinase
MARQGLADARQAIQALRRDPVGTLGLVEAARSELEALRARSGVAAELTTAGSEPDLDDEESHVLYRIVQEALRNVERHADATEVHMHIEGSDERVQMVVSDNGLGFEPHAVPGDRYGLLGMQERAAMVGAELDIRTHPGGGTDIVCTLER